MLGIKTGDPISWPCRSNDRPSVYRIGVPPRAGQASRPVDVSAFSLHSSRRQRCGSLKATNVSEYGAARDCPIQGCWDDLTAADIMTPSVLSIDVDASVFIAMETLVEAGVSGLPVVDDDKKVVGVVSAYDVLALDCTPGQLDKSDGFFPPVNRCINEYDGDRNAMWREFLTLRESIQKAQATLVGDSMHKTFTVPLTKPMSDVADFIVQKRLHRVFVVDGDERLIGVISRGDIMRATVNNFRFLDSKA
ncbi:hypothetical protein BSKO_03438 [Bryopsis sp. KO-2023]|nr:hypothetical protein BSKO_03438 [Bryopsis sp. KO-2023]